LSNQLGKSSLKELRELIDSPLGAVRAAQVAGEDVLDGFAIKRYWD
jgi:hypothetical protein